MMKRIIYLILAVSVGLNIGLLATTLVVKKGPGRMGPPGPGQPGGRNGDPARMIDEHIKGMTQHLGLDSGQQTAIRNIMEMYGPEMEELRSEVDQVTGTLADIYSAPEFDANLFKEKARQVTMIRAQLDSLSAESLVAESAILTPEQRRLFAEVATGMGGPPQGPPRGKGRQGPADRGGPPPPPPR
jgi:Spy/CpxP family protein refolding chaperone